MEKDIILRDLYYSPKTGFRSIEHLWKMAKEYDSDITKSFVKKWLETQATYTKYKKWNNPKHYRHTFVRDFDHVQMDLIETTEKEKKENGGNMYIFVAIEILSRTAFAYSQRSKDGDVSRENIEHLIRDFEKRFDRKPKSLQSDQGYEFKNRSKVIKEVEGGWALKWDDDISWYYSKSPRQASVVERFIRTLRGKMWKMFHAQGNLVWVDNLQDLIENYNNTVHRSIKMKPVDVNEENKHIVWLRLFGHIVDIKKPKFQIGDRVRISHFGPKATRYREMQMGKYFKKKYEERDSEGKIKRAGKKVLTKGLAPFSEEIFIVTKVLLGDPNVFKLYSEEAGYEIMGIFYKEELSLVREERGPRNPL